MVADADAVFEYCLQLANAVLLVTCTLTLPPDAMSPKLQVSVLLLIEQPETAGLIDHETPDPVGSASLSVTLFAVPGPLLLTPIVKPMELPALTVAASAVFVMCRLGHCTVTFAEALPEPSFPVATEAWFEMVAQLAKVVGLVMCTDAEAPDASVPKLHVSVPLEMEHPATAGLIDQESPDCVGSWSVTTTLVRSPAPELEAVMVKPIDSPAFTVAASAVLVS